MNMDLPIDNYYINSAKNPFDFELKQMNIPDALQLGIPSNMMPLFFLFYNGVRYFELEIYDSLNEPIVLCGSFMDKQIPLKNVLTFIHKYCFKYS